MPTSVRYTVVDGEVIAEKRSGVRRQYVPDPLGSTVALLDNTQAQTDTFGFWPYGEVASRTGTTATPYQYVGTLGYYTDNANRSYVDYRVLNKVNGRWMTQDPIGFDGRDWNLYRYVGNNPVTSQDNSGLASWCRFVPGINLIHLAGCGACAQEIFLVWYKTDNHDCNHQYMHCMACCVLTKRFDDWCARNAQQIQNWKSPHYDDPSVQQRRNQACELGIIASQTPGTCRDRCAKYYPYYTPGHDLPPWHRKCQPLGYVENWHLPSLALCGGLS